MGKIAGVLGVLVSLVAAPAAAASPSSTPEPFPVVNGSVSAIAVDGDTAYLGGDFTRIGPPTGPMALLSAADGRVQRTFRGIAARRELDFGPIPAVWAIEPDGQGGWYAGGEFLRVDGLYRASLVHLLADGSVDPAFSLDTDGEVKAIALDEETGTVWVGGDFDRVRGERRPSLVAADATTGAPRPWVPGGVGREVTDIEIEGERVYAVGAFRSVEEEDRAGAAAFARDTGRLLDWDPRVRNAWLEDIDVHDGIAYLAGTFYGVAGTSLGGAAAVRESDASIVPVDFAVRDDSATSILATDDVVIVGGVESTRDGIRDGLAAYDRDTGALLPWFGDVDAGPLGPQSFAVSGSALYTDGVERAGAEERNGLAAFDLETGELLPWAPAAPDGTVLDIEAVDGQVAIGGRFRMLGGLARRDLAAVDLRTNAVTAFDAGIAPKLECCFSDVSHVAALAVADGSLWVGGDFTRFGADQDRPYLARLDVATGAPEAAPPAPNAPVRELHAAYGRLYLGGAFTKVGGQDRRKAAALDLPAGTLGAFAHDFGCDVRGFASFGAGELLTGGCFSGGVLAVDPGTGAPGTATPRANAGPVNAVAPDGDGGAWVGGEFWSFGDGGPEALVRLRADGSLDPRAPLVELDDNVYSLVPGAGEVFVSGTFDRIGGANRGGVTVLRPEDGAPGRWDPRPRGTATAFAPLPDGGVLMGGGFDALELGAAAGAARFGPARAMPAPVAHTPPVVAGDRYVEGAQRLAGADFSGSPLRREVRWLRCDGTGQACEDSGRRGDGIVLRPDDVGHRFRVEVVAENDSAASAPVISAPGPLVAGRLPESLATPAVSGTPREGEALTMTSNGRWSGEPTSFTYRWRRCGRDCEWIDGATGTSHTLTAADVNTRIEIRVRAANAAGAAARSSISVGPVEPAVPDGIPRNTRRPTIAGAISNPGTLFAEGGAWTDHADTVHLKWERCAPGGGGCVSASRNGELYDIEADDAGFRLRVSAAGQNERGIAEPAYSDLTPVIPPPDDPSAPDPTPTPTPTPTPIPSPSSQPDDVPPATGPPADSGAPSDALVPLPPWSRALAPTVRVRSVRAAGGRRVIVSLTASASVRVRIEVRRAGRAIAGATRDIAGATTVRLRLTRGAWRRLQRRGRLPVTVVATTAGGRHAAREVLRR